MSVFDPNHPTIPPRASCCGSARARCHRYSPSARRSRNSVSYGSPVASERSQRVPATGRSSGCTTRCHPSPMITASASPKYSTPRGLT